MWNRYCTFSKQNLHVPLICPTLRRVLLFANMRSTCDEPQWKERVTRMCADVKDHMPRFLGRMFRQNVPCSYPGKCHYSFDFAQQVHFPSDPLQPGPIYFKRPRKCGLFCIACEAFPRQINFLLDENVHTDKGANTVVSMLHYFLNNYGIGECHLRCRLTTAVGTAITHA